MSRREGISQTNECSVIDVQHSCLLDVLSTSIVGTLEKGKGNRTKREEGRTS